MQTDPLDKELSGLYKEMRHRDEAASVGARRVAKAAHAVAIGTPRLFSPSMRWAVAAMALLVMTGGMATLRQVCVQPSRELAQTQTQEQWTLPTEWKFPTDNLLTMTSSQLGYVPATTTDEWLTPTTSFISCVNSASESIEKTDAPRGMTEMN